MDSAGQRMYEIRVLGKIGPAAAEAFSDLVVETEPTSTVLIGTFKQDELHALFDRVRSLGLELIDVKESPVV